MRAGRNILGLKVLVNRILVLDDDAEIQEFSDIDHCLDLLNDYALVQGLIVANEKLERRSYEQPFLIRKGRTECMKSVILSELVTLLIDKNF